MTDVKEALKENETKDKEKQTKKTEKEKSKEKTTRKNKNADSKEKKKIKELQDKTEALELEKNALKDQYLRKIAEFDNYKKRTEKEFLAHLEFANEGLITELLPVIDDFERSLDHADKDENKDSLKAGIELIYKKFMAVLTKKGLKPIEAVGQEFDPEKHQALLQVDSDEYDSGYVVDEHLKGYAINNKVIRHSQVLVSK